MMKQITLQKLSLFALLSLLMASCGTTSGNKRDYVQVNPLKVLKVEFANSKWNEEKIPIEETCKTSNSHKTPSLIISQIPVGTNAIIMEYSDKTLPFMDNGGHGKIGYALPDGTDGTTTITIPSLYSNTLVFPNGLNGFWVVAKHKNLLAEPGAYMPPCSGGKGKPGKNHNYSVTIKAVYHAPSENEESKLLATKELGLGTF